MDIISISSSHSQPQPEYHLKDIPLASLYRALEPITIPPTNPRSTFINWGLSYRCTPLAMFEPTSEHECALILELARREGRCVRAAGVGHSPSDLACTTGYMVRTEKLCKIIEIGSNSSNNSSTKCQKFQPPFVIAQAGITLHALHAALAARGLAMINVGSISDQTLGGVVTTATHGSGINFPVLSDHVLALVLLLADGSRVHCSRTERPDLFMASICGLGATGLILEIALEVEPAFRLKEVQETRDFDDVVSNIDNIARSAEHVRIWWYPQTDIIRVLSANRTTEPATDNSSSWLWDILVGFHIMQFLLFLGRYIPNINPSISRFAAWLAGNYSVAVDDSHRIFNLDCMFPQFTTEWAIPYANTRSCLHELRTWLEDEHKDPRGLRPHFPIEIRFSAPDDIWLSPSSGQITCWIGIVQFKPYGLNVPYRALFTRFEEILSKHGGRPHWAKAHRLRPDDLRRLYPAFDAFVRVLEEVDPRGMFRNPYVQRHVFGVQGKEVGERVFKCRR